MKRFFILTLAAFCVASSACAQQKRWKEQALEEFRREHYHQAIALMEKAAQAAPCDPEVWYYLGWFNHYLAYDSRPAKGYDRAASEKIFDYLDKALELDPGYGDAKYFYGAECGGSAFIELQRGNAAGVKRYYQKAFDRGAYPPWRLELARNTMARCDRGAILFTGGGSDTDVCHYLQLCENFRTDLALVVLPHIERPWYVRALRDGLKGVADPVAVGLDDDQIGDIHPYKWDTATVAMPFPEHLRPEFGLNAQYKMEWTVEPDLTAARMASKIESEAPKPRTLLSPQRAMLLQIVENNFASRPLFFTNMAVPAFYGGLDAYFRNCGMVSQLVPVKTSGTRYALDVPKMEALFRHENFRDYRTVLTSDMPRISGTLFTYHIEFLRLAAHYRQTGRKDKLQSLIEFYKQWLAPAVDGQTAAEIVAEAEGKITNE